MIALTIFGLSIPLITFVQATLIMLVLIMLLYKEIVRAIGGPHIEEQMRNINILLTPLLLFFFLVIVERFASFL